MTVGLDSLKHVNDVELLHVDFSPSSQVWPFTEGQAQVWLDIEGTLTVDVGIRPQYIFEIDNSLNVDYCFITFAGEATATDMSYPFTAGTDSVLFVLTSASRHMGDVLAANPLFATHPIPESNFGWPASAGQYVHDSVGCLSTRVHTFNPMPGQTICVQQTQFNTGFPVLVSQQFNYVVPQRWQFVFPVGELRNGDMSISGIEKMYMSLVFINPECSPARGCFPDEQDFYISKMRLAASFYEARQRVDESR